MTPPMSIFCRLNWIMRQGVKTVRANMRETERTGGGFADMQA